MPTESELALVQQCYKDLRPHLEPTSLYFYEALFARAPHLRELFREDLKGQGMRFMTTLGTILQDLENPEAGLINYAELGQLHQALGVRTGDFEPMEEALMDTLRDKLGDDFTPELKTGWRKAYRAFAARLIEEGHIAS